MSKMSEFGHVPTRWGVGGGFRYLAARKVGMYGGVGGVPAGGDRLVKSEVSRPAHVSQSLGHHPHDSPDELWVHCDEEPASVVTNSTQLPRLRTRPRTRRPGRAGITLPAASMVPKASTPSTSRLRNAQDGILSG
ncbi:MAG: hypothetical protein ACYSUC_03360 [Planctomycetota bacterium]